MSAGVPHAEVTVYSPLFSPFRQRLEPPLVSIGRASDCTIPVKDRYLSRRHAELVAAADGWLLKDLGSANGTYLNGTRVQGDASLAAGDRIRLGDTEIVFIESDSNTDKFLAVAEGVISATISIPVQEIDTVTPSDSGDIARLQTLTVVARELIEDRPMSELFGFIVDRVLTNLGASRAALGLVAPDGKSFTTVEVRRADKNDTSELTISRTVLAAVVDEKRALSFVDVSVDEKLSRAKSIVMQGIHSIICAPVMINGAVAGVLYVDYLITQRAIAEDDVRLVAQIARFAAMKLEQTRLREEAIDKRLIDEELKTASAIQRRLLATPPSAIAGYTFAGANRPCRSISGDYYDFVVRPDGQIYFVIADVSGKGITAGLIMSGLQTAFRIFCKGDPEPATLVEQLNAALKENLPQSKFVTLFLGRLHTASGRVEYANAGHVPPLWMRHDAVSELGDTDLLLGVVTSAGYMNREITLAPGDALILFTDGLSESEDAAGALLGADAVPAAVRGLHGSTAGALAEAIDAAVLAHVGSADEFNDDVTLVVVSREA